MKLRRTTVALAVGLALTLASCGSDDSSDGDNSASKGGTLRYGAYLTLTTLDPMQNSPAAVAGGTELAAIFDNLVTVDPEGELVYGLAESLEPNADSSQWTMTLRDSVEFSDGTPFDAEAVVANVRRAMDPEVPTRFTAQGLTFLKDVKAKSPTEVKFVLNAPLADFGGLIAQTAFTFVAAPSYLEALASGEGDALPIGAGPFVATQFRPTENLTLKRNDSYFGEAPNLDGVEVSYLGGGTPTYEALKNGQLDMANLWDAPVVKTAMEDDSLQKSPDVFFSSSGTYYNAREGSPMADPRLRLAAHIAADVELFNDRVQQGGSIPTKAMFPPGSEFEDVDDGPDGTIEDAKALVAEAKADGFDGKVIYECTTAPDAKNWPVVMQASLNDVGFDIDIKYVDQPTLVQHLYVTHDFEMSCLNGFNTGNPGDPYLSMWGSLASTGTGGQVTGHVDPEVDKAIDSLRTLTDPAEQAEVLEAIAERNNTNPAITNLGYWPAVTVSTDDVNDLEYGFSGQVQLNNVSLD